MRVLASICIVTLIVSVVEGLQRILGGTSKAGISFENLKGQKETIEVYAYVGSSIGALVLVVMVANLCYLLGAKNDAQKKIYAEMSEKASPRNAPALLNDSEQLRDVSGAPDETNRQIDNASMSHGSNPRRNGEINFKVKEETNNNSSKRKLLITSSGQLRKHVSSDGVETDPITPLVPTQEIPVSSLPAKAEDRPRRKLKMKVHESGILQFHAEEKKM